jgi:hypothetical protein
MHADMFHTTLIFAAGVHLQYDALLRSLEKIYLTMYRYNCTVKKEKKRFLIYKEIQKGGCKVIYDEGY